ncbi:MAG: pyridoxamine 5'-phosphate oxidase family protein [Hyphomicrobiales bacterium]
MTPAEIRAFLARPLTGVVGTIGPQGAPHGVPVWFRYDDERVTIWTGAERRWVRNLAADPRCSFTVQEQGKPFAAVTLRGRAVIATDEPWVDGEIRAITSRYIDKREVEQYIAQYPELRTVVSILPGKIVGWTKGY